MFTMDNLSKIKNKDWEFIKIKINWSMLDIGKREKDSIIVQENRLSIISIGNLHKILNSIRSLTKTMTKNMNIYDCFTQNFMFVYKLI